MTAEPRRRVAVIGGGPAGLMAAEVLSSAGAADVDVYDTMPSVGRKFLLAGIGGLNLTHAEPFESFVKRYGERSAAFEPLLARFGAGQVRAWAHDLGIETFVGTSARVFPTDMKAAPLLRAWLHRLRASGVRFHMRHRCVGWDDAGWHFESPQGPVVVAPDAVVLALGGGSWPRLGSDGAWVPWLVQRGVDVAPLRPSNCGFDIGWSENFKTRQAGQPVKPVALTVTDANGSADHRAGEFVVTEHGIEGSLVYAFSSRLRDEIERSGSAGIELDLLPSHDEARVRREVAHPRGSKSLSSHLKSRLGLGGVKAALLWEVATRNDLQDPARVARLLKALPLRLVAPRPLAEAISTAGGVTLEAMDDAGMLKGHPGVFCAGEMTDWEAPTGGYLLTACLATGRQAGQGALAWLEKNGSQSAT